MSIFKFALVRNARNLTSITVICIIPVVLVFIPTLWTGIWQHGFYLYALQIMAGSFILARGILNDRVDKTIYRILSAPISIYNYLMQNLLAYLLPLLVQIVVVVTIGALMYGWGVIFSFALILCYTIFAIASVSLSFAWNCLFRNKHSNISAFVMLTTLVGFIGGFWFPVALLPDYIRFFGMLFPAYWVSNSIYNLGAYGLTREYWLSLMAMLLFSAVYLLYGGKRRIV